MLPFTFIELQYRKLVFMINKRGIPTSDIYYSTYLQLGPSPITRMGLPSSPFFLTAIYYLITMRRNLNRSMVEHACRCSIQRPGDWQRWMSTVLSCLSQSNCLWLEQKWTFSAATAICTSVYGLSMPTLGSLKISGNQWSLKSVSTVFTLAWMEHIQLEMGVLEPKWYLLKAA